MHFPVISWSRSCIILTYFVNCHVEFVSCITSCRSRQSERKPGALMTTPWRNILRTPTSKVFRRSAEYQKCEVIEVRILKSPKDQDDPRRFLWEVLRFARHVNSWLCVPSSSQVRIMQEFGRCLAPWCRIMTSRDHVTSFDIELVITSVFRWNGNPQPQLIPMNLYQT